MADVTSESGVSRVKAGGFVLEVVKTDLGDGVEARREFEGDCVRLGRSEDCDFVLPSFTISRRHAEIRRTPAGFLLADTGSANGVWVDDAKVGELLLKDGQEFRIGNTTLKFVLPTLARPEPQPPEVVAAPVTTVAPPSATEGEPPAAPAVPISAKPEEEKPVISVARELTQPPAGPAAPSAPTVVPVLSAPLPAPTPSAPPPAAPAPDRAAATPPARLGPPAEAESKPPAPAPAHPAPVAARTAEPAPPAPALIKPSAAPTGREIKLEPAPAAPATHQATAPAATAPAPSAQEHGSAVPQPAVEEEAPISPLVEAFRRFGEPEMASGIRPFLLKPKDTVWYLESGKVEVFTISLDANDEPVGTRGHFISIEPGQLMFGMDLDGFAMGSGFLAVGRMGTHLRRLSISQLRDLAADERYAEELAGMVDTWVSTLSRSLTKEFTPGPLVDVNLLEGADVTLANQQKARSGKGVLWLDVSEGNLLFIGMEELVFQGDQGGAAPASHSMVFKLADLFEQAEQKQMLFPVTPDSWIEASNTQNLSTHISGFSAAAMVSGRAFWRGLDVFHQVLCQCEFINKKLAAVDEFNRLKSKAEYSEAARDAAYRDIAQVLEFPGKQKRRVIGKASGDFVFDACLLVGEALGMTVKNHPEANRQASFTDRVAAVAKASRFRTRVVVLRDDWWRQDQGPILGRWEKTSGPVALLPNGPNSYEVVDPKAGTAVVVDDEVAAQLSSFALTFYRPFPDGPLAAKDLIKFGARGLDRDVWMLAAMGIAMGLLGTLTPYFTGRLFDSAIPQADRNLLVQFTAGLFMAALVSTAFKITQSIATLRIQGRMDYSIQAGLWDRLLNLPSTAFRDYSAGDLADRAGGIDSIRHLVQGAGIGAILGSLSSVFYIVLMFKYSLILAIIAMALTFIYVGFTTTANYMQLRQERTQMRLRGKITGLVLQFISGVGKLRVAGAENHAFRVWATEYSAQRRVEFKIGRIKNTVQVFGGGFPIFSSMAIFYALMAIQRAAAAKGQPSSMTTGDFIAFNAAYSAFLAATQSLGDASLDLLRVVPIYERLKPIITTPAELDETKAYPGRLRGEIDVSHVSFRYSPDGPWILDDLSIKMQPGEYIAFVGSSGCGKSTLMRLLLGFEMAEKGTIYFDGQDIANLDLREVRQQIGVVLQTSKLLPSDVFRNIIGSTDLTINDAWEAATLAGLADDIRALPMGMHTYLSEGGGGFSGGQQQKLLIARALVRKPRILIFDEATSALDNRSQKTVTESMDRLQATRIVIAHRLSTIINADRICYLEKGHVIEQGTYEELMKLDGKFALLAKRQMV